MTTFDVPVFCVTSDIDWASDWAIQDFCDYLHGIGIPATLFATHASPALDSCSARDAVEIGSHPNFLAGSSHGNDVTSVARHIRALTPGAKGFRSHYFFDSTSISREMVSLGYEYDSNLCLWLQEGLEPLWHATGLTRFPVFWEDDVHWTATPDEWDVDRLLPKFLTPGLKVLSIHPFFFALNVPNAAFYQRVKPEIQTLSQGRAEEARFQGPGTRTFVTALLETLVARRERFATLGELHEACRPGSSRRSTAGRVTDHSEEEYHRYWKLTDAERQDFVQRSFDQREASDIYATSRDFHVRELEIEALARHLGDGRTVLDLGCGNGYTLLSLAVRFPGRSMVGVDFSEKLIAGARELSADPARSGVQPPPFVCADAVHYVAGVPAESIDCVITERFLQNLPSEAAQHQMIKSIYRVLVPGGRLLMCEGSQDGFGRLNDLREAVGLNRIPATSPENVTALRFNEAAIDRFLEETGFRLSTKLGFSLYFAITRALHPLLVSPLQPQFDAPINASAARLQLASEFSPGLGSNVVWILEK